MLQRQVTLLYSPESFAGYITDKEQIGKIREKKGLYQVYMIHLGEEAGAAGTRESLSINELHHCLGLVSRECAKLLITKGLVEGVTLDKKSEPTICESCECAKGTRKVVVKVREGEGCKAISEEVHLDLWGPSPVKSLGRKRYYISFTDDYSCHTNVYFLRTKDKAFNI